VSSGLAGKTALVTGASRGIGQAIAFTLAGEGANVVISSRRQESLDKVAAEIIAAYPGANVLAKAAHVGEPEQAKACVDATLAAFGSLDVLVNNAGTNPYYGPLVDHRRGTGRQDRAGQPNVHRPVDPAGLEGVHGRARRHGAQHGVHRRHELRAGHRLLQRDQGRGDPPDPPVRR